MLERVRQVCQAYLDPKTLLPVAREELEQAEQTDRAEEERTALTARLDSLTAQLDKIYLDKLNGLLDQGDFERIYRKVKTERAATSERLDAIQTQEISPQQREAEARELVRRFLETGVRSREVLVSLIERVELTEDKQVIIHFKFPQLEGINHLQ